MHANACVILRCLFQVENFGRLRYERSREALEHGRILTQRHEATEAELAMSEGDRPLVSVVRGGFFVEVTTCSTGEGGCDLLRQRCGSQADLLW